MRGDILIIGDHHRNAALGILELTRAGILSKEGKFIFTIAGESGSGKSELASALKDDLEKAGIPACILQQDDYFEYPPKTNAKMREGDISRIGPGEVRLDLLNKNLSSVISGKTTIEKPLVFFAEDRITSESVDLMPFKVIIIDGTYTTLLDNADCRIFIDRDNNDTREDRLKRSREKQDEYLERILEIEHNIISRHKSKADIIVDKDFKPARSI
jgi:uridine kinase